MPGFFGMPTRGGKLTIVNCLLWVIVLVGALTDQQLLILPGFVICWPIAWLFIAAFSDVFNGAELVVIACVMIGVNSILWGYGISWLLSCIEKRKHGGRGFEVIIPTPAIPLEEDRKGGKP